MITQEQYIPLSEQAKIILNKRYLLKDKDGNVIETPEQMFRRVAKTVASAEKEEERQEWEDRFYELMASLDFLPNSPTIKNAGTGSGCLSACFVVSPQDSMESILQTQKEWGVIEKWGGGVGAFIGHIRPKGSPVQSTHGKALGPLAVLEMLAFNANKITQGSFREGAHMGQMNIDHTDIREFIHFKDNCKLPTDILANFNISIQIPDSWMQTLIDGISAEHQDLWDEICNSTWRSGDPGIVFIDEVERHNPNPDIGKLESSNPCSEEWLENYGSCNLGSIDLSKFTDNIEFDWERLSKIVTYAVRFLDNVIDVNQFALPQLKEMNLKTRRIGLGIMGWADALAQLNISYDSQRAVDLSDKVACWLTHMAQWASSTIREEKCHRNNSSVTTIAPTGSISILAGCSSGIEPYYSLIWERKSLWQAGKEQITLLESPKALKADLLCNNKYPDSENDAWLKSVLDLLWSEIQVGGYQAGASLLKQYGINPELYKPANNIDWQWHVKHLAAWQKHITNGVSKTINMPNNATVTDISNAYKLAWSMKCKSLSIYRDGCKNKQVLNAPIQSREKEVLTSLNKVTNKEQIPMELKPSRPAVMPGETFRIVTGHGNLYVTVNYDDNGNVFEIFSTVGKAGKCDGAYLEAISRLVSVSLQYGVPREEVIRQLRGITCCPVFNGSGKVSSIPDAIAYAIGDDHNNHNVKQQSIIEYKGKSCVQCEGGSLVMQEGCEYCLDCGWSKC